MNRLSNLTLFTLALLITQSCIQDDFIDDFVEPELRITSTIDTLALGDTYLIESTYLNATGQQEFVDLVWDSSDPSILSVNNDGLVTPVSNGAAYVIVSIADTSSLLADSIHIVIDEETTVSEPEPIVGTIVTTSSYRLEGSFMLEEVDNNLKLSIGENYVASTALPGLYVYLSNNRNSIAGAREVGRVETFMGAHSYDIANASLQDYTFIVYYCKPFNVKVGEAEL